MSELETYADAKVEELKADETFDLADVLNDVTYPTDEVTVYLKGDKTHEYNLTIQRIAELAQEESAQRANENGMTESPELEAIKKAVEDEELKAMLLLDEIRTSSLTFHMRGLAPAQWRIIVKQWEHKIKPETKSEEDVTAATVERNRKTNAEIIATSIVKTVNAKGQVSKGAITIEAVEKLNDVLLESEYARVLQMANQLTFANNMFHNVLAADADFLSKS